MAFKEARDKYEAEREIQRTQLREFLSKHEGLKAEGLKVVTRGGKGSDKYRGNYNLQNWKWVQVKSADGFDCVISLNMLDRDRRTRNIHSLFDRIGLILTLEKWLYTDIDLPFIDEGQEDYEKEEKIAQLVVEQYKKFKQSKGEHEL